jgi:hypothetical protein
MPPVPLLLVLLLVVVLVDFAVELPEHRPADTKRTPRAATRAHRTNQVIRPS